MRKIVWKVEGNQVDKKTGKKIIYDCFVQVDDEKKLIIKIECQCWNFRNVRLKSVGTNAYKKIYADPCKHLMKVTYPLEKIGYKLKKPSFEGTDKPNQELKDLLLERSEGLCESSGCNQTAEKIHRIIPGHAGGKYSEHNCSFICFDCHKTLHKGEFKHIAG